ncbi:uncharacterized protein RSE6_11769 [Rhynchosporium secalis]|uniref:Uncharacterized protein n=1 Tax=Rhynchosporium secalis TaxID=38038 RepID=A0A1E1MNR3_RHYSE|nr:uncharacterized protein RSE6_11769 [Rhynchosporium secalis]
MILDIAQSTSRESSLAIAPTLLLLLEEVEEVYSDNSSSIEELLYISYIVLNTRIAVKVDDSEIGIVSGGAELSALAPEATT